jgi:hypothetical protein
VANASLPRTLVCITRMDAATCIAMRLRSCVARQSMMIVMSSLLL